MKKNFLGAVLLAAALTGCQSGMEESGTEVRTVTETSTETSEETSLQTETSKETATTAESTAAVTEREYMRDEKQLIEFLEYLQNGSSYCFEFGNPIDVYDFMDDFIVDSYSYEHRGDGVYDVKLTCSGSSCEMFPDGDSYWVFSYNFDTLFIPAEREKEFNVLTHEYRNSIAGFSFDEKSRVPSAYRAAVDFSLVTGVFEADADWFESCRETNTHGFFHAYLQEDISESYTVENGERVITAEDFVRAVKKLYNVTLIPDRSEFFCAGHGGSWLYDNFAGYEETEDEIKVRVDYYGDELYLFVTVQSEYTFSKNEDGTITLQNVEKIFDRGYEPARGSI